MSELGFNRILTLLRKERGITQKEAAQSLGISQALLSHYEKGIRECGLEFLVRVADFYGVSCDYLLGRSADRSGLTLSVEDIPEPDDKADSKYRGSVLPVLNKKLLTNSLNVLFDLLQKIASKELTTEMSGYLMLAFYKMFRLIAAANPKNPKSSFSVPMSMYSRLSDAEMATIEAKLSAMLSGERVLGLPSVKEAEILDISPVKISEEYPLFATSLMNLIQFVEKAIGNEKQLH